MSQNMILLPVVVQVLLTFAVLIAMGYARRKSMAEADQTIQDMALAKDADWNEAARKCSNNYKNQFELPVLFYAVCAFALIARYVDPWMMVLATVFVATRIGHTVVHLGSNIVVWRGTFFLVGAAALLAMWLLLVWRVVEAGI